MVDRACEGLLHRLRLHRGADRGPRRPGATSSPHAGWTKGLRGRRVGARRGGLEHVQPATRARENPEIMCLAHGGPLAGAEDIAISTSIPTRRAFGASSIERSRSRRPSSTPSSLQVEAPAQGAVSHPERLHPRPILERLRQLRPQEPIVAASAGPDHRHAPRSPGDPILVIGRRRATSAYRRP